MTSDFRSQFKHCSSVLLGTTVLAAAFLPACVLHPNRNQDLGVAVTPNTQPDKMLFQKAQAEIDHGRYDVGRLTLQVLINTYPDSEYLAKAKLLTAESYYKQGGISGLTQSEAEYKDFITFFPTAPEAPEAEYRAGMAHFRLMGKADRDLTEARAAEAEFKTFLEKYPDNSMVPAVKGRLREVQEVLAEGDYTTALLYYRKGVQKAASSRFQEIADNYPSFSQADQALWYLGQAQEKLHKPGEAVTAYDRLLIDYPLSISVAPAKTRLVAMHRPVPKATKATLARARADRAVAKQTKQTMVARVEGAFTGGPDLSATRHGPVRLGEHPAAIEQAQTAGASGSGSIVAQPLSDSGSAGQAPPSTGNSNPGGGSPTSPSSSASPNTGGESAPAENAPSATTSPAGSPPSANAAAPAAAGTAQPAADAATSGATTSAKSADSNKSTQSAPTQPASSSSDPPKKSKFHFLKKLVPF
jgi:outer membrane protein assembly factor BamD